MRSPLTFFKLALSTLALWTGWFAQAAAPVITGIAMTPRLTIQSDTNVINQIQYTTDLSQSNWTTLTNISVSQSPYWFVDPTAPPSPARFYRVLSVPSPGGMALVGSGSYIMGDAFAEGGTNELPAHPMSVSGFYMDTNLVTYAFWMQVYEWATNHGYAFDDPGSSYAGYNYSKGPTHPVHLINWYDAVKWCNARSEMSSLAPCYFTSSAQTTVYRSGDIDLSSASVNWNAAGYRLPTEAEWEKAARGGDLGQRFPWAGTNVISWNLANYYGDPTDLGYDLSTTNGYDPTFSADGIEPFTSPVGSFPPNAYGFCDMAGNVWEWCWDWFDGGWYSQPGALQSDTRGPAASDSGSRVLRGGSWYDFADYSRCAYRGYNIPPNSAYSNIGFRCVSGY
jgi:formylglycine-generating enzyme required for sulfatase activity